jgi:hypothetical protein
MTDREGNTNASRVEEREARIGCGSGYAPTTSCAATPRWG